MTHKKNTTKLQLNCDMGESFGAWHMGQDQAVMPYINQASIACGFHASDPDVMASTIKLAMHHQVSIGAHPGYADLQGFGRRSMAYAEEEIKNLVLYQIGALSSLCEANNTTLQYIKPHGALYNDMMKNEATFCAIVNAIALLKRDLPLMIQAGPKQERYNRLAKKAGVNLIFEAFLDRQYLDNGSLMPRSKSAAVLTSPSEILQQAKNIQQGYVITDTANKLLINADSLCIHGDNLQAIQIIEKISATVNP